MPHGDDGHDHDEGYDREMSDVDWAEVYGRQVARAERAAEWFDDLGLGPGDPVVDVGCGPGHLSLLAADRVDPAGVYALDRAPGALAYLARERDARGVENVEPVVTDAEALAVRFDAPLVVLLTYVLHHAADPPALLSELAGALAGGSRLFACEYLPDGAGEVGPPLDHRIAPGRLRSWMEGAGFGVDRRLDYDNESYALVARR